MGFMSAQSSSAKSVRVMIAASDCDYCDYSQPRKQMKSQHMSPAYYSEMNASHSQGCKFLGTTHSETVPAI